MSEPPSIQVLFADELGHYDILLKVRIEQHFSWEGSQYQSAIASPETLENSLTLWVIRIA